MNIVFYHVLDDISDDDLKESCAATVLQRKIILSAFKKLRGMVSFGRKRIRYGSGNGSKTSRKTQFFAFLVAINSNNKNPKLVSIASIASRNYMKL